jgi:hypothetical protein
VDSQPDQTETPSAQQAHPLEFLRKSLAELTVFFRRQQRPHIERGTLSLLIELQLSVMDLYGILILSVLSRVDRTRTRVLTFVAIQNMLQVCLL